MSDSVLFHRRPFAAAAIFSAIEYGAIPRHGARVVVIGCGDGEDAIALAASLASGDVIAVDSDRRSIRRAKNSKRKAKGIIRSRLVFRCADAIASLEHMDAGSTHAVIDTLAMRNIVDDDDPEVEDQRTDRLVSAIARILRPTGIWILHEREDHKPRFAPRND